jgi:hypothetical protein
MKDRNRDLNRDKDKFDRKEHAQRKLMKQRWEEEELEREWDNQMREIQLNGNYR